MLLSITFNLITCILMDLWNDQRLRPLLYISVTMCYISSTHIPTSFHHHQYHPLPFTATINNVKARHIDNIQNWLCFNRVKPTYQVTQNHIFLPRFFVRYYLIIYTRVAFSLFEGAKLLPFIHQFLWSDKNISWRSKRQNSLLNMGNFVRTVIGNS